MMFLLGSGNQEIQPFFYMKSIEIYVYLQISNRYFEW